MPENHKNEPKESTEALSLETRAGILQDTFKHYYAMAMDHHTKAATTSNVLVAIVAAILGLISLDQQLLSDPWIVCALGGVLVVIGLFGATWVWKQHERYKFWSHIAKEYQKELQLMWNTSATGTPEFKTGEDYYDEAKEDTAGKFGWFFAQDIDRWLWVFLHGLIVIAGVLLIAWALFLLLCAMLTSAIGT